ncbi:vacuolar protein sorting-associated protein 54 [Lentinula aciculospora]|uniref:Vacuolar protein sorting-associated protein 54 n=1 Tax=Lentinula aciculospora TaxID=153920 RepID=A0A9W9ASK6_9AGAR|nr:vacuolar protein sorting-associated protein 54 [Lentinula aciculospora]
MSSGSPTSSRASTPVILTAVANASSQCDTVTPTADPSSSRYRFTWDPERRGPESVSGTTAHGQDYFAAAPAGLGFHFGGSTASLNLGALPTEWSSSKHGFHAISTVLNNPHKKQAPPKAHSSLPSVMPAELPRVRRKDFDSYLQAITPGWEKLEKSLPPSNSESSSQFELQQDAGPSNRKGSIGSLASFSSLEPLNTARLQALNSNQSRNLPPLDSVPSVFFQHNFDLGNPQTFALVTEQDKFGNGDPTALANSLPLLDKFSHYADTVELHLSNEIAARAPSFFAALTNLHTLQSESTATLSQISRLRTMLQQVDENVAKKGLEVVGLEKRVRDVKGIERSVEGVKEVVKSTGEAREKVGKGMWGDALVILGVLDDMWHTALPSELSLPTLNKPNGRLSLLPTPEGEEEGESEPPPPAYSISPVFVAPSSTLSLLPSLGIPLSQLNAFSALPSHLRSLTLEIASSLSDELVSLLRYDLLRRFETGGPREKGSVNEDTKNQLTELLEGLRKTKGLKEAILSWRQIALDEFRDLIRKHFLEVDSGSPSPTPTGPTPDYADRPQLATHLRSLSHSDFMSVIRSIYRDMLSGVERLHAQISLLGEISESIEAGERAAKAARQGKSRPAPIPLSLGSPSSSSDGTSVTSLLLAELTDTLSSATELAHTQAAQLLSSRSEIHAKLSLLEFVELFNETWRFVVRCEVICRRMIVGLRGAIVSQAKGFLQAFHQARLTESAKLVEDEQWSPQDVTLDIQTTANSVVDAAMKDPPELLLRPDAVAPVSPSPRSSSILSPFKSLLRSSSSSQNGKGTGPPPVTSSTSESSNRGTATSTKNSKHIYVESSSFFTVPATSAVLSLLTDYLAVIINLSILTTDTMSRIIEFLKAFNSRTCQVVLGAGAMRSAGLKNITAKHLALASQSLSIMIALVPYIRETFRRHLNSKQAVMLIEFDKLKRDYQEHQHEIHAKLIAIMGDRLSAHIKSLQAIDWNVPKTGGGVNDYIVLLVKETVTLHKVLSRYLSAAVVEDVMSQVFAAINHRLSEEYSKIELPHAEAKLRLLEDVRFLHQKLSALKTVGKPSMMLETVVQEKPIPKVPGAPPTPTRNGSKMSPPNSAASNASTNQRLRGLLSGRTTTYDRSLPKIPGTNDRPPPPHRSNTSSPNPDYRTTEDHNTPTVYRSLSPNPYQRSDRPRTPPPPPLPIDVEAEVPSPPPDGSSGFGFREIEAPPDNISSPTVPASPRLTLAQKPNGDFRGPPKPALAASDPIVVSEVVSNPSTNSLDPPIDASIPSLSPEIEDGS